MKLFVLLVIILVAWNVYRSIDVSTVINVDQFLNNGQQVAEEDLCPEGQKPRYGYIESGWGFLDCYIPTKDAGKKCLQSMDCLSKQCKVTDDKVVEGSCEFRLDSQSYVCSEIYGECSDSGTVDAGFYIGAKNHVFRLTYY